MDLWSMVGFKGSPYELTLSLINLHKINFIIICFFYSKNKLLKCLIIIKLSDPASDLKDSRFIKILRPH